MVADTSYYFICNPASNSGRAEKEWLSLVEIVENKLGAKIDYEMTIRPKDGITLAETAVNNGYNNIIAVGGDGITNEVLNGIMQSGKGTSVNMGIIPVGTSNDSCRSHDIGTDAIDAIDVIVEGKTGTFPVGKVTGSFSSKPYYFFDHCDTGLAALSARSAINGSRLLRGEFKYTFYAIKHILGFKNNPGTVIIDGIEYEGNYSVAAVSLGETMAGYHLWPDNTPLNGDFGIILVKDFSRFGLLKVMLAAENGNHIKKDGVEYLRGKSIEISFQNAWPYQAEGEIFADNITSSKIEYLPNSINVISNLI